MMKIAYTGWTWVTTQEPEAGKKLLEASFRECKHLGYDYVENFAFISDFYPDPNELVELQKQYDVKLVNLYGHFNFDVEESLARGKKQVEFLSKVGGKWYNCQNAGFGDGGPPERPPNPEMLDKTVSIANKLGEYAKSLGVTVCFHPHYNTCVFTKEDIDYFAAKANPDYVSFCIDTAHTTLAGLDSSALIKSLGKRVEFIHFKDVDTYALSKAEGVEKMGTFRALGLGVVNFPEVYGTLQETGYDGVICVELDRPAISNYNSAEFSRRYLKLAIGL